MRAEPLPAIFGGYQLRYVRRVSYREWCSECPACGGEVHASGEWPDRCRWFLDAKPLGWCRRCLRLFWPGAAEAQTTPGEAERWRREQVAREEARRRRSELALRHLREGALWLRFHRQMGQQGREFWRGRGIPDEWQDRWSLGWSEHYPVRGANGALTDTAAATIPLFGAQGEVQNVKLRLVSPPAGVGRYRYLVSGRPHQLFLCNPVAPLTGHVIVVEGEIKAAVTYVALADERAVVVGLPGASPSRHILAALARAQRVTLVMDPGAEDQAAAMAQIIGPSRTGVLIPPQKIDDLILATRAGPAVVRGWLGQAQPVAGGCVWGRPAPVGQAGRPAELVACDVWL